MYLVTVMTEILDSVHHLRLKNCSVSEAGRACLLLS